MSETLPFHRVATAIEPSTASGSAGSAGSAWTGSRTEHVTARATRVVAVAAPLLMAGLSLLHPEFEEVEEIPHLAVTTNGWYALHAGYLVLGAVVAVAAFALARVLRSARPLLPTIAAGITCVGAVSWMALMAVEMALPTIAKDEATWPTLVEFFESANFAPFMLGFVLLPLGLLLLGVAALRDQGRPRWHGALIVVGTLLTVPEVAAAYVVGFALTAAGFAAVLYRPTSAHTESR